jgi:protein-S-isoprenylcysteine O-methyltransferase Ste14
MAMIEELERSGNWLFRGRSYFPLALYALMAVVIGMKWDPLFREFDTDIALCCIAVSMLGLVIRALTIGYTPRGTSGRNTKAGQVAEVLNTKGMYSLVRHPLYLGNFFMWLGIMIYVGNLWFTVVCCLLYWLYYERIMFAEEGYLRVKFGQSYLDWSVDVPSFWPRNLKWKSPDVDFSVRNVLKREYNGLGSSARSFLAKSPHRIFCRILHPPKPKAIQPFASRRRPIRFTYSCSDLLRHLAAITSQP